jgi:hypothetical protein
MAPLTTLSSHERTRVEDYLNDKIQVSDDLESLDSLLSSLRAQQELQRKQVLPPRNPDLSSPILIRMLKTASGSQRSPFKCNKGL